MTGKRDKRLESQIVPVHCQKIYQVFVTLSRSRNPSIPISLSEMKAYGDLTGYELLPREIETIQAFDAAALNKRYEIIQKQRAMSAN